MTTLDDIELLRRYAEERSEAAFSEIVRRHLNLVYSAALRVVGGDAHRAEDVAQVVFGDLARQAARSYRSLSLKSLPGWLYTNACFVASKVVRGEQRRHAREQEAHSMRELLEAPTPDSPWNQLRPVIDAAMLELGDDDREAVVLRYFDGRKLAEVGNRLGLSENAARMRVERAMEKLRALLAKRGITSTTAALALVLANQAVSAAPAGLAATITAASLAGAAVKASGISTFLYQFMTMTKLKIGILGVAVATGVTTPLVILYRHNAQLSRENLALLQEVDQLTKIRDAVEKLPTIQPNTDNAEALRKQQLELLRLRGMIGVQRRQEMELPQQLEATESQADLAKFELDLARQGPSKGVQSWVVTPTSLPGTFDISTLQPAGRDTAVNAAQSLFYAVFHNGVDAYYDLDLNSAPTAKNERTDRMVSETLAHARRMWGGDAAQGIKNLKLGGPIKDGRGENRYSLNFMIDYGAAGRPAGAPTHGSITLQQTLDGWKAGGFGSSIDPTVP